VVDKDNVRVAIIDLAAELSNDGNDPSEWSEETIASVNEAFDSLDIEKITKEFKVLVQVTFTQEIELIVDGASLEDVRERIENGDFEDDVTREVDVYALQIESYDNVMEA
jgi:hypothetical protein